MNKAMPRSELAKIIAQKPPWLIRRGMTLFFLIATMGAVIWYFAAAN